MFVARIGDISSHGGVIAGPGSMTVLAGGFPVARLGDMHVCPIPYHGATPLFSMSTVLADGLPVVRVGDAAGCGAVIVTGCFTVLAAP